jgi:large conductance mechanosensitive channel
MAVLDKVGAPAIKYGLFINDVISFVILGFVIFMFIKGYNKMKEPEEEAAATTKTCNECAMDIPVAAKKCGHCGSTNV